MRVSKSTPHTVRRSQYTDQNIQHTAHTVHSTTYTRILFSLLLTLWGRTGTSRGAPPHLERVSSSVKNGKMIFKFSEEVRSRGAPPHLERVSSSVKIQNKMIVKFSEEVSSLSVILFIYQCTYFALHTEYESSRRALPHRPCQH